MELCGSEKISGLFRKVSFLKKIISINFLHRIRQMHFFLVLLAVDEPLGRLEKRTHSDQTLMEIVFDGLSDESKRDVRDAKGYYLDVCQWLNVKCDAERRVVGVSMVMSEYEGRLALDYLPPLVTRFQAPKRYSHSPRMGGTLTTLALPKGLLEFDITEHGFSGTVDLRNLPENMLDFDLTGNFFTGSCDLTALPCTLESLSLRNNKLSGTLVFDSLPESLKKLSIGFNKFAGPVNFAELPQHLERFFLQANEFCGDFRLVDVPESLTDVLAYDNLFSGTAVVLSHRPINLRLHQCDISRIVDANGCTHESEAAFLRRH